MKVAGLGISCQLATSKAMDSAELSTAGAGHSTNRGMRTWRLLPTRRVERFDMSHGQRYSKGMISSLAALNAAALVWGNAGSADEAWVGM